MIDALGLSLVDLGDRVLQCLGCNSLVTSLNRSVDLLHISLNLGSDRLVALSTSLCNQDSLLR